MDKKAAGVKARREGKRFETQVQADLEKDGWLVMRFMKKVENGKLINSRPKWVGGRLLSFHTGFPDFICLRPGAYGWSVALVECKLRGLLSMEEKEQVRVLRNEVKLDVLVAYKDDSEIRYKPALADS